MGACWYGSCSRHFYFDGSSLRRLSGVLVDTVGQLSLTTAEGLEGGTYYIQTAPHELKVAAACLCAGLMPPSIFADLLEDHRPDLAEVANFLREWERLKGEQK